MKQAGQLKDFVEGLFVYHYGYGKGWDPEDLDLCEQWWAQVDSQGTKKMLCHTLTLLFQSIFFPRPARFDSVP